VEVFVPELGDFDEVEVVEILVKPGDEVSVDDPLITLETDKASLDVPSPAAGRVAEVKVAKGDRVSTGDLVLLLESDGDGDDSSEGDRSTDDDDDEYAQAEQSADDDGDEVDADADAERDRKAADKTDADAAGESDGKGAEQAVTVPDLGDFADVEVVDILVAEGDEVDAEQGLIALETEKATVEVPSPAAGTIVSLKVKTGERVSTGDEIAVMRSAAAGSGSGAKSSADAGKDKGGSGQGEPRATAGKSGDGKPETSKRAAAGGESKAPAKGRRPKAAAALPPVNEEGFSRAHASPSVRKLARELGVDLASIEGSGAKGRVTDNDVKAFVKGIMDGGAGAGVAWPEVPDVDFAKFGDVEVKPLTRIQKISGPRLHASWVNLPHVTQYEDADITALEEKRQELKGEAAERGVKLTPLAFIMRAVVLTLEAFPRFRSSLSRDGESLVIKNYMHIGFAADTPNGLLVPVIRDADKKDVYELASALAELSGKARDGKLGGADMQGGVFTISSLGGIGGTAFTPIINAPEVAILGVSRHQWRPVYRDGGFVPRLLLPLSLSYDHRVIDGAEAARFAVELAKRLEDVSALLEAIP
jgi:pyruvate dehydrogenase E2 component (dihydrolipoamide acetyltransferase)